MYYTAITIVHNRDMIYYYSNKEIVYKNYKNYAILNVRHFCFSVV